MDLNAADKPKTTDSPAQGGSNNTNITFDEGQYNELIRTIDELESSLPETMSSPEVVLDSELALQPGKQIWDPAVNLVAHGQKFGASVQTHNEQLRQKLVKFRNALQAGKDVFNETNDLANYDAQTFVAQYPDFNTSGATPIGPAPHA